MATTIFDLPKYILNYLPLDVFSSIRLRATCRHMRTNIIDRSKDYNMFTFYKDICVRACLLGDVETLKYTLSKNRAMLHVQEVSITHAAVRGGHVKIMDFLHSHFNFTKSCFERLLYLACRFGSANVISWCKKSRCSTT